MLSKRFIYKILLKSEVRCITKSYFRFSSTNLMKKNIFVGRNLTPRALECLNSSGHDVKVWDKGGDPTEDDWVNNVKGMHGIYSFGPQKINKRILDAAGEQLEIVSAMSVGVDSIDLNELRNRGIKLGHTPGVLTDAVADIAVSLILTSTRRVIEMVDVARNGEWSTWDPFEDLGCGLRNSTVGIVGLGRIGVATAKRLLPFGVCRIVYTSRSPKPEAAKELNATYLSFQEVLRESDFVLACCSLNPSTIEMFNKEAFLKMKKTAIFVNIGRGSLVDQNALVDALSNNIIRGAGLDVTTPEPLPVDHPLFKLKNCVILPHIGSAEERTRDDMAFLAAKNLISGLNGEKMPAQYPL